MTHLEILNGCVSVINAKIACDSEFLDEDDLNALRELRFQTAMWLMEERRATYLDLLKDFLKHLDNSFPDDDDYPDPWEKFYNTDFVVTFGDKSITLYNSADTFSDIQCLIKREIGEYEE